MSKLKKGQKVSLISGLEFTVERVYELNGNTMVESQEGYGDFNIDLIKKE